MFHIALFEPCIPQNTGAIIRLAANTGAKLHLIYPMKFTWDNKKLIRSGLDYHEFADIQHHENWHAFTNSMKDKTIWALTTHGKRSVFAAQFKPDDVLLFGSESAGLSAEIHTELNENNKLRLPMQANSRSINIANSVAAVLYFAFSQNLSSNEIIIH